MNNQIEKWNKSHSGIPTNKSVSVYASEKERLFPRNATVCEVGGGTGADSIYFLQQGHKVILLDISDFALSSAAKKAGEHSSKLETHRVTLGEEQIPLEANSVDVIYSRLALHYFNRQTMASILKNLQEVLKNGGKAFISIKSPNDEQEMVFLESAAKEVEPGVYDDQGDIKSRFTKEQLEDILRAAGIQSFGVNTYVEDLGGRVDRVKSGNSQLVLNEIQFTK